jgi:hypothetical protein
MRKSSKVAVSDVAVLDRPVTRTAAIEACYYPVEDTMSGGYSLDSGLHGPVTLPKAVDVFPNPAAFFLLGKVPTATVATPVQEETPDVLAPYYGKQVSLTFLIGKDPATGENVEMGIGVCLAEAARNIATNKAASSKLAVIIRDANTNADIDLVFPVKVSRATSTHTATPKVSSGMTAEQLEAKRLKEEEELREKQRKAQEKEEARQRREREALAIKLAKALAATRNAPEEGTEQHFQFIMFTREQGATPKEQNYSWNARNPGKIANFGWKQIAQGFVRKYAGHVLLQGSRPCEASASEGKSFIGPAFRIIKEGETIPAGWYAIASK